MGFRLHEPAVALTDLAIGVEAGVFAIALARTRSGTAAATLAHRGGPVLVRRLLCRDQRGRTCRRGPPRPTARRRHAGRRRLWRVSLGSIGVAALSAWCLGAFLSLPRSAADRVLRAALVAHAAYLVGLARTNPPYGVAIATYLPGAFALAGGLVRPAAGSGHSRSGGARAGGPWPDIRSGGGPGQAYRSPPAPVRSQRDLPYDPGDRDRELLCGGAPVPSSRWPPVTTQDEEPGGEHDVEHDRDRADLSSAPPGASTSARRSGSASIAHTARR